MAGKAKTEAKQEDKKSHISQVYFPQNSTKAPGNDTRKGNQNQTKNDNQMNNRNNNQKKKHHTSTTIINTLALIPSQIRFGFPAP